MSDEAGEVSDRRSDAHPSDAHPLILFDGVCNLCNATIQSIIERDGAGRFRFAPLQSRSADTEHESVTGSDQGDFPDSILLVDSVGVHTRSSAAESGTVSFYDRGAQPPEEPMFTLVEVEVGMLRLEGEFEGKPTTVVMQRYDASVLLLERRFRWINEYPFNR